MNAREHDDCSECSLQTLLIFEEKKKKIITEQKRKKTHNFLSMLRVSTDSFGCLFFHRAPHHGHGKSEPMILLINNLFVLMPESGSFHVVYASLSTEAAINCKFVSVWRAPKDDDLLDAKNVDFVFKFSGEKRYFDVYVHQEGHALFRIDGSIGHKPCEETEFLAKLEEEKKNNILHEHDFRQLNIMSPAVADPAVSAKIVLFSAPLEVNKLLTGTILTLNERAVEAPLSQTHFLGGEFSSAPNYVEYTVPAGSVCLRNYPQLGFKEEQVLTFDAAPKSVSYVYLYNKYTYNTGLWRVMSLVSADEAHELIKKYHLVA